MSHPAPRRVGASFSMRRCTSLGISGRSAFDKLLNLNLGVVRLSAYWDEVRRDGYGELDWLMDASREASQPILLTVGMKAMRWPEFYIPADVDARAVDDAAVKFVSETVARYRDRREVIAWQVENEPFNRSGPQHRWIAARVVRREMQSVRTLDARPIVLNAFTHFDDGVDDESRPRRLFGLRRLQPEQLILDILGAPDILGLDVYTTIGARKASPDWPDVAARWLRAARGKDRDAWVTESQAEPWGTSSFTQADMRAVYEPLARAGFTTILLWGVEHWFGRAAAGDSSWLDAVKRLVDPGIHD